jgi:hypothetical protein
MVDTEALKSGDILGGIGFEGFDFGIIGTFLIWVVVILFIGGILAVGIIWLINKKKYKLKIWVFGRVGGVPMLKTIDTGKLITFGMAGDKLLQLKKLKKYLPTPQIQMGKDIYWFYEREDSEFINFSLTDIDKKQKEAGAYYVDNDMRMQRLGIEKNLRERLTKMSFFEKYGTAIAGVIFVIMVTVALVVLFSKLTEVSGAMESMSKSVEAMASSVNKFYTKRVGGEAPSDISGLVPALIFPILFRGRKKWLQT